jgi:hypothetical protein
MRSHLQRPLAVAALAVLGLLGAGVGHPAGSSEEDIRVDEAAGTIEQDLPDLSEEAHDEAALEAESDRVAACLTDHGLTGVESDLTFDGPRVSHRLEVHRTGSGLSAEEAYRVEARCTARLAVLITDFEPAR